MAPQTDDKLQTANCKLHKNARIFVAGHRGLVGSAIVRELEKQGATNLITRTRSELDLLDQKAVGTVVQEAGARLARDVATR